MSMAQTWLGPRDGLAAQQIGIDPVPWRRLGGVGPAIDGLDAHPPHQRCNVTATNCQALLPEQVAKHPATGEWVVQMQLIDAPHQPKILG